ncbi:MAG: hypothetical protein QF722_06900, partial [Candidatus Thalassarchaeaceae archaeon]|nr:hypothetical protein [Candidatus Thalassarchaeaceae archaeon]
EISNDQWVEVENVEAIVEIDSMGNWSTVLELPTQEVEESEIHRYQLVARDRHIDIDWVTIEPLEIKPHTARDGEALSQQINDSKGLFVLYIIAVLSLCFGVSMLVLYRREKQSQIDDENELLEQSDIVEPDSINVQAPPGFEDIPPPANMVPPPGFENMPEPNTVAPPMPASEINVPLDFSNAVFSNVVSANGIHDGAAFLSFAANYDADGNGYLRQSELNRAAAEFIAGGHNQQVESTAFSDEQLIAGGWTQEQIDNARASGQI